MSLRKRKLPVSIARNIEYLSRLSDLSKLESADASDFFAPYPSRLTEHREFGVNPGELRMLTYVPANLPSKPALVVVLHGCAQNAASYDIGAGWSQLADDFGFVLLFPQQRRRNNASMCFNWFVPEDVARDGGEAQSIHRMIEHVARERRIDRKRIFVTGLSAGGSMAAALLACYPHLFAAGAIVAGLPYGAAGNLQDALNAMFKAPPVETSELGRRLRAASSQTTRWPRISIWHGSADTTVHPANADHLLAQWLDVHGLPSAPMFTDVVDGHPRYGWWDRNGDTVVETFAIRGMAHGVPLASLSGDHRYGRLGPYIIEAGISSSWHIARFFGLTMPSMQNIPPPQAVTAAGAETTDMPRPARLIERARQLVRRVMAN